MAGWSSIRIKSAKELRKNPNAYFYRHVASHEHQARPLPHLNCTSSIMPRWQCLGTYADSKLHGSAALH
jgi:hypothetical protein